MSASNRRESVDSFENDIREFHRSLTDAGAAGFAGGLTDFHTCVSFDGHHDSDELPDEFHELVDEFGLQVTSNDQFHDGFPPRPKTMVEVR